jgi:hypothetical protein
MPKRESKAKDWLRCESVPCRNACGEIIDEVMVEEGTKTPPRICPACMERGKQNPCLDVPADFRGLIGDYHRHGPMVTLQRKEIARLVKNKQITPMLKGVSKIWVRRRIKTRGEA